MSLLGANSPRWLLAGLLLLGACTVETPYQPIEGRYGYGEQQLEQDRYRVTFSGNPSTPRETVQNYLLYRAAELTIENGFDYFTIVERDVERDTRYFTQGFVDDFGFRDRFRRQRFRRAFFPSFFSANAYPVSEYSSLADVVLGEGDKPKDDANAYDALDVLQQLQPLIRQEVE